MVVMTSDYNGIGYPLFLPPYRYLNGIIGQTLTIDIFAFFWKPAGNIKAPPIFYSEFHRASHSGFHVHPGNFTGISQFHSPTHLVFGFGLASDSHRVTVVDRVGAENGKEQSSLYTR